MAILTLFLLVYGIFALNCSGRDSDR